MDTTGALPSDLNTAEIMAETIASIVGEPGEDAELSDISNQLIQQATNSFDVT